MNEYNEQLNSIILDSYKEAIKGISKLFGSHCEVLLHSLKNYESSVISIENGSNSGRTIGAPITNVALEVIKKINSNSYELIPYESKLPNGDRCRSITVPIKNGDVLIGLMCINFNLDVRLADFVSSFSTPKTEQATSSPEQYSARVEDLMDSVFTKHLEEVLLDTNIPNQDKNKTIILRLNEAGFFQIRGSVETIAEKLKISVHTIYSYIRKKTKNPSNESENL